MTRGYSCKPPSVLKGISCNACKSLQRGKVKSNDKSLFLFIQILENEFSILTYLSKAPSATLILLPMALLCTERSPCAASSKISPIALQNRWRPQPQHIRHKLRFRDIQETSIHKRTPIMYITSYTHSWLLRKLGVQHFQTLYR